MRSRILRAAEPGPDPVSAPIVPGWARARGGALMGSVPGSGGLPSASEWPNRPGGYTTITENDVSSFPGTSWTYNQRSSSIVQQANGDYGQVARYNYPQGFTSGSDPGFWGWEGISSFSGLYIGFIYRVASNFTYQNPGMKVMHMMGVGWNVHHDLFSPGAGWVYETRAGTWGLEPTSWGQEGADGWPDMFSGGNEPGGTMNNISNEAAAIADPGVWQRIELQFVYSSGSSGIIRHWVDGVLCSQLTSVSWPNSSLSDIHWAGTWGGGNIPTMPETTWAEIAHVVIAGS